MKLWPLIELMKKLKKLKLLKRCYLKWSSTLTWGYDINHQRFSRIDVNINMANHPKSLKHQDEAPSSQVWIKNERLRPQWNCVKDFQCLYSCYNPHRSLWSEGNSNQPLISNDIESLMKCWPWIAVMEKL